MASRIIEDFRNPELPFVTNVVGGLFPGRAIVISGVVLQSASSRRFFIDLCCGLLIQGDHMDNKALHFNPRFDTGSGWFSGNPDRQLVINSFINNLWGQEERFNNPFEEGKPFQIRILVLENYFKIAVNGKHLCDYGHRVPIDQVKTIFIDGNIHLNFIEFQPEIDQNRKGHLVVTRPVQWKGNLTTINKPVFPFVWKVPACGFVISQSTQFTLTPYISANRFNINFLAADEYFFHFRVDFPNSNRASKAAVVRNSTKNGCWQVEEREIGQFPFSKGITYDIRMIAYERSIAVDVNGVPFIKFNYREGDNPAKIDKITVEGDCILQRFVHLA